MYETGKALLDCGVVPGADMTPEAALAKLSYVLSKVEWNNETKRKKMQSNLVMLLRCLKTIPEIKLKQTLFDL